MGRSSGGDDPCLSAWIVKIGMSCWDLIASYDDDDDDDSENVIDNDKWRRL